MKVIRLNSDVYYLGFCLDDQMYHFSIHGSDFEAYSRVKVVDCGVNNVYYCDYGGKITLNWKPVTESKLKSIINKSVDTPIDRQYHQILGLKFAH